MSKYSIKDLEMLSGIKAHTLRIWEQRYGILNPDRTDTNIRFYDNQDLRKLLNISILNNYGIKISKIVNFSEVEIKSKIEEISKNHLNGHTTYIDQLVVSMIELNEASFETTLKDCIDFYGFENTFIEIVFPFMKKIGIMWQTGTVNPAQEHFISNLIRQKIIVAIDSLGYSNFVSDKKFLLFLPDGELHEISLLFANYIIRKRGFKAIYLGQSVPFEDLFSVYAIHKPEYIVSIFTFSFELMSIEEYVDQLAVLFLNSKIYLSGFQLGEYNKKAPQNVQFFKNPMEFINTLEALH